MLDVVTSALEIVAVTLMVVAAGWVTWLAVAAPYGGPAALAASAVTAWSASHGLQWVANRAEGDQ